MFHASLESLSPPSALRQACSSCPCPATPPMTRTLESSISSLDSSRRDVFSDDCSGCAGEVAQMSRQCWLVHLERGEVSDLLTTSLLAHLLTSARFLWHYRIDFFTAIGLF